MRLPAELKILGLAAFSVLAVAAPSPWLAPMALVLLSYILLARANVVKLWRMFRPAVPFILFICAAQAILAGGPAPVVRLGIVSISQAGIESAIASAVRIVLLYFAGSAVTVTTVETELLLAIQRFLSPLGRNFCRDVATMMMLALAFMPTIAEEYASIRTAQEARGISYRGPIRALRGIFSIIVPLLYSLASRADNVAVAMESRCYGQEGRKP